ncbi:protein FAM117B-like [Daphnia pulex]|uniref:protein FAM117B-like n=1 Tax=Daphnia pulex TaxID=6669 RepID=UPI001EDC961D|nr:protein FAM117B-like [Daphnia pulex]XP_046439849.1 protein FAM117B-like [Daphnia pulex]XP_046439850.1 protein FAM117B-like [Daphnia pulex]
MTSNTQPSQKLRRNGSPSTNKSSGPLRATIPVSLMSQSVILDVPEDPHLTHSSQSAWSKINLPHTAVSPANTLQCGIPKQTPWRMRQWSPTPIKVENPEPTQKIDDYPSMRRTASLDAIYLKGQWPRGTADYESNLLLDKATQTPEEWMADLKRFSCRGVESSPSRDRKQKQRFFLGHQGLNPPLIQQYSSGSISPNRVAVSTNTEQHPALPLFGSSSDNKKSRAIPVPPPPTTQSSRARNSVEGFNTEIEKLVCRGNGETTSNKVMEPTPDGHRAPIAELFKRNNSCRSVDTQTPVKAYSTNSSSGTSSPCGSVSPSVWVFDHHHSSSRPPSDGCTAEEIGDYNSLSPEDFQALSLGTSPRNRFLCREPPDGCEKVETLKIVEHTVKNGQDAATLYCPPKPSSQFVLQPSSSSAFCSLNKFNSSSFSSAMKSSSSSHLFGGSGGGGLIHGSNLGECSDRSSSVPPQWPIQQQQISSSSAAVQMIPATPSGQPI